MKPIVNALSLLILLGAFSGICLAAPFKLYVAEFNVAGAANSGELRHSLQAMLASRIDSAQVRLVEKADKAEFLVSGSYTQFGKMFSLDILIKNRASDSLVKVFEQGEGEGEIIPAIGRLARKIDIELAKGAVLQAPPLPAPPPAAPVAAAPAKASAAPQDGAVQKQAAQPQQYTIKAEPVSRASSSGWSGAPIDGVFGSIAYGRTLPSGERELFVAGDRIIRTYLQGKELKLVAEVSIAPPAKILAIDTADLDGNGIPELYVSIVDRETVASRVYTYEGSALTMTVGGLPWLFRGIGQDAAHRTIYVQELATGGGYYGDLKELALTAGKLTATNPLKLPRSGNIFNFNRLDDRTGGSLFILLDEDGHLVVFSRDGAEVWKSSDSYGGSEKFFKNESAENQRRIGDQYRWTFLEQRVEVLKDGTVVVPRNEGIFTVGNNRSYDKYSLYGFDWSGAVLKEKWHTRQSPGYLADVAFDQATGDVILLEVVQKAGMVNKGKTVISINRID